MIKKITTILHSPLGYNYKCVILYNCINNNKINGTFYIGNPKTKIDEACVTISVFFPLKDNLVDSTIASLILLKYYKTCSENKNLIEGEGTVDMITTSLSFVKQICPFIKEFKLNDSSTKKCDNGNKITLPYFYITQKNKTWYEGRFGAYLKEPDYTNYKTLIIQAMNTLLPDFNTFYINHINNTNTSETIIDELKSIYVPNVTLRSFLDSIYKKYDKNMGCIILQSWIDKLMTNIGLHKYISSADWFISADNIPNYKFKYNNKTNT